MIPKLASLPRAFPPPGIALACVLAFGAGSAVAADTQRGGTIYSSHCAVCHGANGNPVMPGTPDFRRMERLMQPDVQLVTAIRNGKGAMPGYFGVLRERELFDVVAYLRTLN